MILKKDCEVYAAMKKANAQTIIQQIQPQCDTLYLKMKDQKDAQHETNQSVADSTGVPISNIAKFFSGTLANPSVFYMAAICIFLGLSLDELLGITPAKATDDRDARIAELETQLDHANRELELVKHHNKYLEEGIAERKANYNSLTTMCAILIIPLVVYLIVDISNTNLGFFRGDDISIVGLIIAIVIIVAVVLLTTHIIKEKRLKKHETDRPDN